MKKINALILVLLLGVVSNSIAQEIDTAKVKAMQRYEFAGVYKSSISFNIGGTSGFFGGSYDVFLSPRWRFEVGAGFPACGIGFSYYPFPIKRASERVYIFYKGVYFNTPWNLPVYQHGIGVGLTFFAKNKWNLNFDLGPMYVHSTENFEYIEPKDGPFALMMNIKAGYRFSFKANKRRKEIEAIGSEE